VKIRFDLCFELACLTQGFVENDGGGIGEVETADGRGKDRDAQGVLAGLLQEFIRQSEGLLAEDQEVTGSKGGFGVAFV